ETNDPGNIFCAGTETALVMTAIEKLAKTGAAADVKCADPFWCVKLVAGDGEKIHSESINIQRNFSGGLHGIGVKENVVLRGDAADFFEGLNRAEFVVGVHNGDQCGLRADCIANGFGIDESVRI